MKQFANRFKEEHMTISTFNSEVMVHIWKRVELPLLERLKYVRLLFTSEGRVEGETDTQTSAVSVVIWVL